MPPDLAALLNVAQHAVDQATALVRSHRPTTVTAKGDRDMVTDLDLAVERRVRTYLRQATPQMGFLGEEEGHDGATEHTWVLDPLDGTANFLRGLALYGISLALVTEGRAVLGIIALPSLGHSYQAIERGGATRDGNPIAAATTDRLDHAVVAVGDYAFGPGAAVRNRAAHLLHQRLSVHVQRVRMLGSAAIDLAWVADGTLDASITLGNNPWDTAAGTLIAREAGAAVTDIDGTAHTSGSRATIAVAPNLSTDLLNVLQHIDQYVAHPDRPAPRGGTGC